MTAPDSFGAVTWVFEGHPDPEIVWPRAYRDVLWWSPLGVTLEIVARIAPPRLTARLQERHLDLHVFAAERSTP